MSKITLEPEELKQLTGYKQRTKQLDVLHKRGFARAVIECNGLVLERAHFEAVCQVQIDRPAAKEVNLSCFSARK